MKFKTYQQALKSVKIRGLDLYSVPEKFITYEICLEAVKQNVLALGCVPTHFQSLELCIIALQQATGAVYLITNKSQDLIDYCKLMNIDMPTQWNI